MRSRWLYHSYLYCKTANNNKKATLRVLPPTNKACLATDKPISHLDLSSLANEGVITSVTRTKSFLVGQRRDWSWSRANRVGLSCSQSEHKICFILPAWGLNPYKSYYSSQEKYLKAGLICTFTAINQSWNTSKDFKKTTGEEGEGTQEWKRRKWLFGKFK